MRPLDGASARYGMPSSDPTRILCRTALIAAVILTSAVSQNVLAVDEGAAASKSNGARTVRSSYHAVDSSVSTERINELIRQLGNPRFTVRRSAANELRQIGPEAFDILHDASSDSDPEVAASARYLLRQITVRWVRSDDPPAVRRLLIDYGNLTDESRAGRLLLLARLSNGEGVAGLCRIARFDRSPLVSRQAALAIIRPDDADAKPIPVDSGVVDLELGPSTRVAASWLRQYVLQSTDLAASVESWQSLIADELTRLDSHADETSPDIALGLLWNLAELHRQLGNSKSVIETADQMVTLDDERMERTAIDLLTWMTGNKSWDILDSFLAKHQSRLEQAKRPLYAVALARAEEGQSKVADELAERAVGLDPQTSLESVFMAIELEERNKFDWAMREYRHVLDTQRVTNHEAIVARILLANLQFDHAEFEAAAETIFPFIKAVQEEEKTAQLYGEIQRFDERRGLPLPVTKELICRYHAYRAGQYRQQQDWKREREELDTAIKLYPLDADVLIAMYRVPEADDAWRTSTRKQIAQLRQQFQQQIDEAPGDPTPYNQWAWLVSNTEGDYEKAVRYSHRSLELNTSGKSAEASYLDTLGRCYYAVGDYENAIKYERQAIERVGHMQVMHRQLALFEKALAEKKGQGVPNKDPQVKSNDSRVN